MGSRRRARERALHVLYCMDLTERWGEETFAAVPESGTESADHTFCMLLLQGVLRQREDIDAAINSASRHWSVSRMDCIDRNLLRVAAYELLFCKEIPNRVSINEALELSKLYGTSETRRFLNGILDRIAKQGAVPVVIVRRQ